MSSNSDRRPGLPEWRIDLGPIKDMAEIDLKDAEWLDYSPASEAAKKPSPPSIKSQG